MGASDSSEKLGQRVIIAKGKLEADLKRSTERYDYLRQHSSQTLSTLIESVSDSFTTCSPFLESTLLIAWLFDAAKCKVIVLSACKKVLRAPINNEKYEWFKNYVFSSNIWMLKVEEDGKFMYEELLEIGNAMSSGIVANMDSIYDHLTLHPKWSKVMAIHNETLVPRQDDPKVGLLQEDGFKSVFGAHDDETKSDSEDEKWEDMKNFIDSNMAINMLTSTASKLNDEFQRHIALVMSAHGTFKKAPMKKVERSISKVEQDYRHEQFPKAAKLLDLVRCSVTFNTVEQLCSGYKALLNQTKSNQDIIELARVKNGFLKANDDGYRDIKVNLIYKSQNPEHKDVRMICEVQLLLINYLEEKKKIHKLYSILREEQFFKMVTKEQTARPQAQNASMSEEDVKKLRFTEALNVGKQVKFDKFSGKSLYKSSVDSEFKLLAVENGRDKWFGVVDMQQNKPVFETQRESDAEQSHHWITVKGKKYLSVQMKKNVISMFKVTKKAKKFEFVEDKKYKISVKGTINFCEFDANFEHVVLVIDQNELQMRSMSDLKTVTKSITLDERIASSSFRNLRLSADASLCGLGGGKDKQYFYVIDMKTGKQEKFMSQYLADAYGACFINGENEFIAVCDQQGRIEIWDIWKKESVKQLQTDTKLFLASSASTHNILAIGSEDRMLRLYDVRNWECFYQQKFECMGYSLHLTEDLKYVTLAGRGKDKCVVLQIDHE